MSDLKTIEQLLNEVQTISESYERVAKATGENFNIFSVLNLETNEVTTHSRFIAEMLNPNGSHGQENEFLELFTTMFSNLELKTSEAKVKTEHSFNNGRIDIIVKDSFNNVIIIENKIYAEEQEKQLLRYSDFLKDSNKGEIFYLTLYGNQSEEDSSENIEYTPISYDNDIIDWLEQCKKKAVDIPILRETISQYINLIKKLTNQSLNKVMSQDIANRVIKDKNSFHAFKTLISSRKTVFNTIMQEKVIPILENIQNDHELILNLDKNKFLSEDRYIGFSYENDKLKNNNLGIFFQFEHRNHHGLIFGFKYLNKEEKDNFNYEEITKKFDKAFGTAGTPKIGPCYQEYKGFYGKWEESYNKLEKILFGEFENDLRDKIKKMQNMVV